MEGHRDRTVLRGVLICAFFSNQCERYGKYDGTVCRQTAVYRQQPAGKQAKLSINNH